MILRQEGLSKSFILVALIEYVLLMIVPIRKITSLSMVSKAGYSLSDRRRELLQ